MRRTEMECPVCGGTGIAQGSLGFLVWYRCEDCGWNFSEEIDEEDLEFEEEED
jgi:rubredoxin